MITLAFIIIYCCGVYRPRRNNDGEYEDEEELVNIKETKSDELPPYSVTDPYI